jgi:hypothetical protein
MLAPKSVRLLALLLGSLIILAACAGADAPPAVVVQSVPSAPTSVSAPISAPTAIASAATDAPAAPTSAPAPTIAPISEPNPTADPITGAPGLARGTITQRPYIVMIDNHPDAYPQTGLDHAAVVFEALAEFGVTRFMAVFAPGTTPAAKKIGPVRSTRLYFAQWAMGFHALYAHAGGSPQGLELVESTDQLINMDALHKDSGEYFARSSDRVAPHNLYTSSAELQRALADRKVADFDHPDVGFLFKTDQPAAQRPAKQQLTYFFIYKEDSAGWNYDPKTNGYLRLRRGNPARDAATGKQLWTKNVVVLEVLERGLPGDEKGRIEQTVVGSGRAQLFLDGVARDATWRKDSAAGPLGFYADDGTEIRLNAGPVWIVALPSLDNLKVVAQ